MSFGTHTDDCTEDAIYRRFIEERSGNESGFFVAWISMPPRNDQVARLEKKV
ncbi:hypothetical protein KIN20_002475 [Parelaphostrongylus tenuis]|uniref:Uncharacterized protein n=1 Tax=Parelaphostrongylus tenuis TaxID=148309 RepID=A0AAD5QGS5_PARTN|nr:hypothetical protein KIN20_002475 [Parelaphostrongylus tenuis]